MGAIFFNMAEARSFYIFKFYKRAVIFLNLTLKSAILKYNLTLKSAIFKV